MKVSDVLSILNQWLVPSVKWDGDPVGLLVGDKDSEVTGILTALNPLVETVQEAKDKGCNLIVTHHPLFFSPVKKLVKGEFYSDIIMEMVKNNISLIACHTNFDLVKNGVSFKLAETLGVKNRKHLSGIENISKISVNENYKIAVYVPHDYAEKVKDAISSAGGGTIGDYDYCFFNIEGTGNFRPGENSDPFSGKKGEISKVKEVKVETIVPAWFKDRVVNAIKHSHPYEEPAIDVYLMDVSSGKYGLGCIGELEKEVTLSDFCKSVSEKLNTDTLRIAPTGSSKKIKKVAVMGGSGTKFWKDAYRQGADVFVTSEFDHHSYLEASKYINIVDATHHATEIMAVQELKNYLVDKTGIDIILSLTDTDPVCSLDDILKK